MEQNNFSYRQQKSNNITLQAQTIPLHIHLPDEPIKRTEMTNAFDRSVPITSTSFLMSFPAIRETSPYDIDPRRSLMLSLSVKQTEARRERGRSSQIEW